MGKLDGKICLITGGARGQGADEARLFAEAGAKVWIADVLDAEGAAVAKDLNVQFRHLDVSDEAEWATLIDEIVATDGGLDGLVNNAGIFRQGRMVDTDLDLFNQVMAINAAGVFLGMRTAAPAMIKSGGGSMVNISSVAGLRAAVGAFAYGASKWAVRGMTKTASVELARKGVRVNSIHPGVIDTPMADQLGVGVDKISKRTPLGRVADPMEVARMALFLISEDSSYSTGSEFIIDGGLNAL